MIQHLWHPTRRISGEITLASSKSISNRVLIIRALCKEHFPIHRLANANDTQLLDRLLNSHETIRDAGPAGTTFRFLTAYLSLQAGEQVLTGSERMKQRPIGPLVEALRKLGANITYLEKEGYPPLQIGEPDNIGLHHHITIPADTSSQYITALLLIAPTLPRGLKLTLSGAIVSRPYIEMTLRLMQYFGVNHTWEGDTISVAPQAYQARPFTVEADWSAASYYYAIAAMADSCDLTLYGLFENSLQGDAVLAKMMTALGVETSWIEGGLRLSKSGKPLPPVFEWDFLDCPDIAQTLAVVCGALGVNGLFTGLETLRIKETDRIAALKAELKKVGVHLSALPTRFSKRSDREHFMVSEKAVVEGTPLFHTYEDHRMAMAFAPLALLGPIQIEDPKVVDKSYPDFWRDLFALGFAGQ